MPIGRFLTHRVSIARSVVTLNGSGDPTMDEYGQPVLTDMDLATDVPASIQPKRVAELAAISQAGVAAADHTIYLYPQDISTADRIVHDATTCPMVPDLPSVTYQVTGVPLAAGQGHHLEVDAKLVSAPELAIYVAPVEVVGS